MYNTSKTAGMSPNALPNPELMSALAFIMV
jgi:hypothetical protein